MSKSEIKTLKTDASVQHFLENLDHPKRKADGFRLLEMMREITGLEPNMWGETLIGFGDYRYQYKSGWEGEFFKVGFSPRKQNLTLYLMPGFEPYADLLAQLGKYKTSKACLYLNKLEDVDENVLKKLIAASFQYMTEQHG